MAVAGLAFLVTSLRGPASDDLDAGRLVLGAAGGSLTFLAACLLAGVLGRRECSWPGTLLRPSTRSGSVMVD